MQFASHCKIAVTTDTNCGKESETRPNPDILHANQCCDKCVCAAQNCTWDAKHC
jgi:hypothetical protein